MVCFSRSCNILHNTPTTNSFESRPPSPTRPSIQDRSGSPPHLPAIPIAIHRKHGLLCDRSPYNRGGKLVNVYRTCGICGDTFEDVHSPITASLSANSSKSLPFGLHLPCPKQHTYCVGCFSQYILSKLDPDGTGGAPEDQTVFPIRCPECPPDQWVDGVPDETAKNILTEDGMLLWNRRKLLDSLPRYYCPNQQCSALLQLDESDVIHDTCPVCKTDICVPCKTQWHTNFTCAQYRALPPDLQSSEDRLLIQLARTNNWRRCKACGRIISRDEGCKHIICLCGRHFCFNCGADWNIGLSTCTREVACATWVENDMSLHQAAPRVSAERRLRRKMSQFFSVRRR